VPSPIEDARRPILVVVTAADAGRASEGLRAGVGLGLRGDRVEVLLAGAARRWIDGGDPRIDRAIGTLARLGRPARTALPHEVAEAAARSCAVEVWTGADAPPAPRRIELRSGSGLLEIAIGRGAEVDLQRVVDQIFEADGAIIWR
jgi:hypothetical protein